MKTKLLLLSSGFAILLFGCKKDIPQNNRIYSNDKSNYASDGILSAQVSLSPSTTPSTFIPNTANFCYGSFDLVSRTKDVVLDYFNFNAPYPRVDGIFAHPNTQQQPVSIPMSAELPPGARGNFQGDIVYQNVDSLTSPRVVTCSLKSIYYHTYQDFVNHTLIIDSASGTLPPMCLVNNLPHINFKTPNKYKVQANGTVEIVEVQLSGDTAWALTSLPVHYYFPEFSNGVYPVKIIAKVQGVKVASRAANDLHDVTLNFKTPIQHVPGSTEVIKIYAENLDVYAGCFLFTEMGDLHGLIWKDGIGGLITGNLNAQFFDLPSGLSQLYNH